MLPKPGHPGETVVEAYPMRPPYPDELYPLLLSLIADEPKNILELGCGTDDVTRRLAFQVAQIDAVDP